MSESVVCDMTDKEMEIQELRRRLEFLEKENEKLTQVHQLDMAEVVNMRRQIEAMERRNEP